jgi:hypothetical protein
VLLSVVQSVPAPVRVPVTRAADSSIRTCVVDHGPSDDFIYGWLAIAQL